MFWVSTQVPGLRGLRIPRLEPQAGGDKPFIGRTLHAAVADAVVRGQPRQQPPAARHGLHRPDPPPGFAAEGAGIHGQRAAQGTGNAGQKFRSDQAGLRRQSLV